jgi:hypothetical protein
MRSFQEDKNVGSAPEWFLKKRGIPSSKIVFGGRSETEKLQSGLSRTHALEFIVRHP